MQVLLIDEDNTSAHVMMDILRANGHQVQRYTALTSELEAPPAVDVVVIDVKANYQRSLSAVSSLAAVGTPVIAFTAVAAAVAHAELIAAGATAILRKPLGILAIANAVAKIGRRSGPDSAAETRASAA